VETKDAADGGLGDVQQAGNLLVAQVFLVKGPHERLPQLLWGWFARRSSLYST
jgi:hypothetical protein